jgi:dolichol kinase
MLLTGTVAAAVEALTPFHLDNLTVPLLCAGLLGLVL